MSITAAPLQPVARRSLWTLWLGLAALLALAIGVAFAQTTTPEIGFVVVKEGQGPSPTDADVALVKYVGKLEDGTVFDENEAAPLPVAGVVPGFSQALKRMRKDGSYVITIPPALGYGAAPTGPIPGNSTLTFEVTLLDFRSEAEVRAIQSQMRSAQPLPGQP